MTQRERLMLTAERLRELLHYDPETGVFTWRMRRSQKVLAGSIAGSLRSDGRIHIVIDQRSYLAHRLAWLYVRGKWPVAEIDHRDCCPSNNIFGNLREATRSQNAQNQRRHRDNICGFKGVFLDKRCVTRPWRACIQVAGNVHFLGLFATPEEAHAAYAAGAERLHGAFARVA